MRTLTLHLRDTQPGRLPYCYQVAGHRLLVDTAIGELDAFRWYLPARTAMPPPQASYSANGKAQGPIFDGEAWLGNAVRRVRSWSDHRAQQVQVAGVARISIASDGSAIRVLEREEGASWALLIEAVLGPALVLALAGAGVFCLHASAVTVGEQTVLFLGDSGAGKSTLARLLAEQGDLMARVSDDVSPVMCAPDGRFHLLTGFPQLKLAASEQYDWRRRASIEIGAIVQLDRRSPGASSDASIVLRHLGGATAFRVLGAQSIASRLFPARLLRVHTGLVGDLVQKVPVVQLTYPSGDQYLNDVYIELLRACEYLAGPHKGVSA